MFLRNHQPAGHRRPWRSRTAIFATVLVAASVVSTGPTTAAVPGTADLVVHAGAVRTSPTAVSGLAGATFQAAPVGVGVALTCVTNAAGTCSITVPSGLAYVVSETNAPAGTYLDPTLDYGGSASGTATPYRFQTARLVSGATVNVPGAVGEGSYSDGTSPGAPFTGLLATSLNNPAAPTACGLKIALILDQSGSMKAGTKQADLKLAANKVITALTGTPSQMAIYTFAAGTGGSVPLTSLGSAAQAAPLSNFVNALPTPSGATNWDQGLAQAVTATKAYDLVVVLTDGNPTTDHTGSGGGNHTYFHNVENGIYSGNAIKNLGSRLVAVGIGVDGGQDNLRAISGPALNSDYYLGTAGNFDDVFRALATGNCDGTLTVQKKIQDFQGNPITNSPAANGWSFSGTVSSPSANLTLAPTATVNGATGFTQSTVTIPVGGTPTITVTEALTAGYAFVGAVCSVSGSAVSTTPAGSTGVSFVAAADVPLACTFTNRQLPPTSSLAVQKLDSTTGAPVAGATFQLHRESTAGTETPASDPAVGSPCTTSGSPAQCVSAATLTFGSYYWVETTAPTGYVLPTGTAANSAAYSVDATHTGTPVTTLTVSDAQITSSLAITKVDATTHVALPGATFQLYRELVPGTQSPGSDTAVGAGCTTAGAPAKCVSAVTLTFGTYYWVETAAPTGYLLPAPGAARNSAPYTIDAAHTGAPVATLSVSDTQLTSSLAIIKLDASSGLALDGATFQLYRETTIGTQAPANDVALGGACTTTGSPAQCTSAAVLPFGTYYWVETVAPTGYVLPSGVDAYSAAYTLDAAHTGSPAATLSVTDAPKLSSLAIRKLDATTNLPVAGAAFTLYREATVGTQDPALDTASGSCTTAGSPAQCESAVTLPFGTYYWVESAAPAGYVLPGGAAAYSGTSTIDAAHTGTPVTMLSVSDAQILSGLTVRKLDAGTGNAVDGALFQLYREVTAGAESPATDATVGPLCTTVAGSCTRTGLVFGTYYWVETAAPSGYALPTGSNADSDATTIDASYAAGGTTVTVSVSDAQLLSSLAVRKLDGTTHAAVAGATFQLYREAVTGTQHPSADVPVGVPCVTAGSPATCVADSLVFGTYYWVETAAPTGYVLPVSPNDRSLPTTIDASYAALAVTTTVSVSDAQQLSSLAVRKLDATTSNPVDGASFQLYRETGATQNPGGDSAVGSPCTTSAANTPAHTCTVSGLVFGTYYWVETAAPTGYVLPASPANRSLPTTIDASYAAAGTTVTVSVSDAQRLSSLAVSKLDAVTGGVVDGATFQLYLEAAAGTQNPSADAAVGTPCTTVAGSCSRPDLVFGTYYWVETVAPSGYVLPASPADRSLPTTIDAGYAGAGTTVTVSVSDAQQLSSLAVQKTDGTTGSGIAGATFQLYREAAAGTENPAADAAVGGPCLTTVAGCSRTGLVFGTYYWLETAAPTGYLLPASPADRSLPTTIDAAYSAAGNTTTVSVSDAQQLSSLTVRKTDEASTVLAGATFELWRDGTPDALTGQCTTGAIGTCSVGDLHFGTYHWVETQAPAFYELPDHPVSGPIVVDSSTAGSTFTPTSFADPATPVATVTKTVRSTTQNADGTWTVTYDLAVTDPSATYATTYELSDTLAFGTGIDVDTATVSGPAGVTLGSPAWNGSTETVVVSHQPLAAGTTDSYVVTVTATVNSNASTTCATGGGFANTSSVSLQADPPAIDNVVQRTAIVAQDDPTNTASACSAPGSPTVTKTVLSVTPRNVLNEWIVAYAVTVSNASATQVSYGLTDDPGLAPGVLTTGTSASWLRSALDGSAPSPSTAVPGWVGVAPDDVLATARLLPAGSKDTYTVTLDVTVPIDIADNVLACSTAGSGHGYFNAATLTAGGDSFPVSACAPTSVADLGGVVVMTPTVPSQAGPGGTLAWTGVQVWQLIWLGIAVLMGGVALLVLIGRRRPERGDVG